MLKKLVAHPLTRGLDIDDPLTTDLRRQIIQEKSFLRQIYQEWYRAVISVVPNGTGDIVELGSGAGFFKDFVPTAITSEVFLCQGIDTVMDGMALPLADRSLRAIVMTNALHHFCNVRPFFAEAARCVQPGGVIAMIEPWVTQWSQLVFTKLHHEPFRPNMVEWEFPHAGPLSGANGALPYIIFERDRAQFEREFPMWQIKTIKPMMPFRYLLSGGVSLSGFMPGWSFQAWRTIENALEPLMDRLAMFAVIVLARADTDEKMLGEK